MQCSEDTTECIGVRMKCLKTTSVLVEYLQYVLGKCMLSYIVCVTQWCPLSTAYPVVPSEYCIPSGHHEHCIPSGAPKLWYVVAFQSDIVHQSYHHDPYPTEVYQQKINQHFQVKEVNKIKIELAGVTNNLVTVNLHNYEHCR